MLATVVWRNVMLLHHGVAVYELRNARGFGMRWTLDIEEKKEDITGEEITRREDVGEKYGATPDAVDLEAGDDFAKDWEITKTTFRGFLEPIAGMDHELDI